MSQPFAPTPEPSGQAPGSGGQFSFGPTRPAPGAGAPVAQSSVTPVPQGQPSAAPYQQPSANGPYQQQSAAPYQQQGWEQPGGASAVANRPGGPSALTDATAHPETDAAVNQVAQSAGLGPVQRNVYVNENASPMRRLLMFLGALVLTILVAIILVAELLYGTRIHIWLFILVPLGLIYSVIAFVQWIQSLRHGKQRMAICPGGLVWITEKSVQSKVFHYAGMQLELGQRQVGNKRNTRYWPKVTLHEAGQQVTLEPAKQDQVAAMNELLARVPGYQPLYVRDQQGNLVN